MPTTTAECMERIAQLERSAKGLPDVLEGLRAETLDLYGQLLLELPSDKYPNLSRILPANTPDDVQRMWTGSSGITLLKQSLSFINFLVANTRFNSVLDFGCGWGRLLRLMLYFVDAERLYGCDAWEESLKHARLARLPCQMALCDSPLTAIPFKGPFELIYAFSVFTHLSEPVTKAALRTLRRYISDDGTLVITTRPIEIWNYYGEIKKQDYAAQMSSHRQRGFGFCQINTGYGDTSMSMQYLQETFPEWRIVKSGTTFADEYQNIVVLKPV
jgi:SAM-dependent methyltransferase